MADDFTCILGDEFKRFIEELPYEELRQSIFTEELEVVDRLLALSERIGFATNLCLPWPSSSPYIALSTGSGWHRKLLSSRSPSSQFTRSLVRPSY